MFNYCEIFLFWIGYISVVVDDVVNDFELVDQIFWGVPVNHLESLSCLRDIAIYTLKNIAHLVARHMWKKLE